jgi:ATP-dependent RNA helicase RhlE
VLPILQELYNARIAKDLPDGPIKRKIEALIIAPTRELAVQIGEACKVYCSDTNMKHTVIFGWVNDFHQIKAIEKWVDILIATPGRLEDLISQGKIKLSYVKILTLDEADRMLDLGFLSDVKKVLKRVPKDKQTFLFSATMPKPIRQLADELLHCPEKITIKSKKPTLEMIDQQVYHIKTSHRRQLLQMLVRRKEYSSIIVFVKKKDDVAYITEYVKSSGIKVDCIHKDRTQNGRQNALKALKNGDIKVLVATDIASRGLDINDLSCVINWNVPNEAETYVHRIGRTARAGKKWVAITMCIDHEKDDFIKIEKLIGQKIKIIDDKSYLEQVISKSRILWYKNFDENGKEKFKDIKRKWAKSRKSDPKYGKAGRLEAKNK